MYMMCELKYNDKMREAFEKGYAEGLAEVRAEILAKGFSTGEIKGAIETCREFLCTKEDTAAVLLKKFSISTKKVEDYIEKFW